MVLRRMRRRLPEARRPRPSSAMLFDSVAPDVKMISSASAPISRAIRAAASSTARADSCQSRIRCQAATGSWTKSRQWETERTLFSSARATLCPPAKVNSVWPFKDAWLRTSLS